MITRRDQKGFSVIELVAVIVITGVLSVVMMGVFSNSANQQLQASRDSVVAALFAAQQRAMAQADPVCVVIGEGNLIDVEQGSSAGSCKGWASIRTGNVQYPLALPANQTITTTNDTLQFDRLGRTNAANITLSQGAASVTIEVSPSGFSQ